MNSFEQFKPVDESHNKVLRRLGQAITTASKAFVEVFERTGSQYALPVRCELSGNYDLDTIIRLVEKALAETFPNKIFKVDNLSYDITSNMTIFTVQETARLSARIFEQ